MELIQRAGGCDPRELVLFGNVPRIAARGRAMLDRMGNTCGCTETWSEATHDCGEPGGTGAVPEAKVPSFLRELPKRWLRAVGMCSGRWLPGSACTTQCTHFRNRYGKLAVPEFRNCRNGMWGVTGSDASAYTAMFRTRIRALGATNLGTTGRGCVDREYAGAICDSRR
ncbi:MAG: hypothetical protein LC130_27315 [Bryobacterales bacterium]|nr:hypothetical protein [Bryobacterales bacterium]